MFVCGACNDHSMSIRQRLALGPDDHSDEVNLQIMRCSACNAGAIAIYEESRRGGGDARWHHDGWLVDDAVLAELGVRMTNEPNTLADDGYRRYIAGGSSFKVVLVS